MLQVKNAADQYYLNRSTIVGSVAGAAAQSAKFIAYAALILWSISPALTTAGTSTYTTTTTGVGTATVSGQQLSVIQIVNTAGYGSVQSLSTTTIGPFLAGGSFISGGTGTAQTNSVGQFALNTASGPAGMNGVAVPQGAILYVVSGTDATAASSFSIDYSVAQFAPLTI